MADIAIQPVETKSQQKRFIRLPWRIYQDDPCWMPPLIMSQEELLGFRPHPFYERSKSRSFLATRGGRDVGRITAIVNAGHIDRYKEQRGFFGFFECDDDPAASRALFQAAGDWLHAQGMTCIRGPANPIAQLRVRPAHRRLRHAPLLHDDPQPALVCAGSWRTPASARSRTCTPSGARSRCSPRSTRSS